MGIEKQIKKTRSIVSVSTYKRPQLFIILTMVGINIIILAIAAIIAMLINPDINDFLSAMGHSIKWLLTPNAILDIEHTQTLILATIVLVIGLILFSGTIIALTTNAIKEYFQKKESNSGKIYLENHIVILNYNTKVPELVSDLLYIGEKDVNIMILSEIDKLIIEKQLLNELRKSKSTLQSLSNLRLLVKQGNPLYQSELNDISIEHAKSILVMNKDDKMQDLDDLHSDMNVTKIILGLAEFQMINHPTIVCEVKHYDSKLKIESLHKLVKGLSTHTIIPICFDRRLGQIMAQTILDNRIDDIYLSLFSFQGSEVYLAKSLSFDDCMLNNPYAIPLEEKGSDLYVLADQYESIHIKSTHHLTPKKLKSKGWKEQNPTPIYVIGKNNKLKFLIESFLAYETLYRTSYPLQMIDEQHIKSFIDDVNQSSQEGTILLLSDEKAVDDAVDTNVINRLIEIQGLLTNENMHIIVELLEPKNNRLIRDFRIEKTIISNKIISLLLSKLSLYPETQEFYEQLLTISPSKKNTDDYTITINRASESFNESFPLTFSSKKQLIHSAYLAKQKEAVLLGYFRDKEMVIFTGNLHIEEQIVIQKSDELIWMKR